MKIFGPSAMLLLWTVSGASGEPSSEEVLAAIRRHLSTVTAELSRYDNIAVSFSSPNSMSEGRAKTIGILVRHIRQEL